jgi:3-deoxy-D-manno-octulosonate 8-phosphate phosphatase (KDO 8-P phosphatase)
LAVAVQDGCQELFQSVDYVTEKPGGRGAVREIAELLLKVQNKWDTSAKKLANLIT